jgi:hypothetical protein
MRASNPVAALAVTMLAIAGPAATMTAGAGATSTRPCHPAWTSTATPHLPSSTLDTEIDSVTALSARDVWFSGTVYGMSEPQPWILHWNGAAVHPAAQTPQPPLDAQEGGPGSFDARGDGWVLASSFGTPDPGMSPEGAGTGPPYAERWHGGHWTMTPLPVSPDPRVAGLQVQAVSSVSSSSAWAAGMFYRATPHITEGTQPIGALIEHWDGTEWRIVPNPAEARAGTELSAVTVVSPADVWVVGQEENSAGTTVPLVEHWDGSAWRVIPVPAGSAPSAFYAVGAAARGQIWATGDQTKPGTAQVAIPLAEHWNGTSWSMSRLPAVGNAVLTGVYVGAPGDVWASSETAAGSKAVFLHLTDGKWTVVAAPVPQEYGMAYDYLGIGGSSADDVWAVGDASDQDSGAWTAVVSHLSCGRPD